MNSQPLDDAPLGPLSARCCQRFVSHLKAAEVYTVVGALLVAHRVGAAGGAAALGPVEDLAGGAAVGAADAEALWRLAWDGAPGVARGGAAAALARACATTTGLFGRVRSYLFNYRRRFYLYFDFVATFAPRDETVEVLVATAVCPQIKVAVHAADPAAVLVVAVRRALGAALLAHNYPELVELRRVDADSRHGLEATSGTKAALDVPAEPLVDYGGTAARLFPPGQTHVVVAVLHDTFVLPDGFDFDERAAPAKRTVPAIGAGSVDSRNDAEAANLVPPSPASAYAGAVCDEGDDSDDDMLDSICDAVLLTDDEDSISSLSCDE